MPKVILVSGVGNSGKTSSIRQFLENRAVFFPPNPRDVTIVMPIQKNGQTYKLGIASAGDTDQIIRENFAFLAPHNCDVIVCASKSFGRTVQAVRNFAQQVGAVLVLIQTQHVAPPQIPAEINRVATEIELNIP